MYHVLFDESVPYTSISLADVTNKFQRIDEHMLMLVTNALLFPYSVYSGITPTTRYSTLPPPGAHTYIEYQHNVGIWCRKT